MKIPLKRSLRLLLWFGLWLSDDEFNYSPNRHKTIFSLLWTKNLFFIRASIAGWRYRILAAPAAQLFFEISPVYLIERDKAEKKRRERRERESKGKKEREKILWGPPQPWETKTLFVTVISLSLSLLKIWFEGEKNLNRSK